MTPRERAKTVTDEVGTATTGAELRDLIEQAITAAVEEAEARATAHLNAAQASFDRRERDIAAAIEEDRKRRPHLFVGSLDRYCEVCNEPDRDERHIFSRESVRASVEVEREACAKIAYEKSDRVKSDNQVGWGMRSIADSIGTAIRARSTASVRSVEPAATTTDVEAP